MMTVGVRPIRRGPLRARVELLLAAFAPLFGLLAWRLSSRPWCAVFAGLAVAGTVAVSYLLVSASRQSADPVDFDDIVDLGDQVAGHVTGYLIPFLVPPDAPTQDVVLTVVTLALLGIILVQSNKVHLNPVLYLLGYRIYSATSGAKTYYLIARSDLSSHRGPLMVAEAESSIVIEKGDKQ